MWFFIYDALIQRFLVYVEENLAEQHAQDCTLRPIFLL